MTTKVNIGVVSMKSGQDTRKNMNLQRTQLRKFCQDNNITGIKYFYMTVPTDKYALMKISRYIKKQSGQVNIIFTERSGWSDKIIKHIQNKTDANIQFVKDQTISVHQEVIININNSTVKM